MDELTTLIIDKRATAITTESGVVRINFDDGRFDRVPPKLLESVVIHGSPVLDAGLLRLLSKHNVPMVITPHSKGDVASWAGAGFTAFAHHRIAQYRAYLDGQRRVHVIREVVRAKLRSTLHQAEQLGAPDKLVMELRATLELLNQHHDADGLRGLEGHAARRWYGALREAISPIWGFEGRNRRPPRDPVNALLSLSYSLATSAVVRATIASGYDPALGFLHSPAPSRQSLVLDLVEPLRPQVDAFVLSCVNEFKPGDFAQSDEYGCRLSKDARGLFYSLWSDARRRWPACYPDAGQPDDDPGSSLSRVTRQIVGEFAHWLGEACIEATDASVQ